MLQIYIKAKFIQVVAFADYQENSVTKSGKLRLDIDAILESVEPDVNLLVEAMLSGIDDEIIRLQLL
jgi:hypothetical protein